ncbi:class I adenylate-forming enzyme family protein [Nocardia yunnanensis]|nr:AMP-binding protein [Nocardia yunnanensis]
MTHPDHGSPEYWALHRPDHPAVISNGTVLTYRRWNDAADRVAEGLARHGLAADDRLGMRFRLAPEWFILQRALQKLGVAQVAVNWRLTPAEVGHILRDSGAKGLACNDSDISGWAGMEPGVLITVGQSADAAGIRLEGLLETADAPARFGAARPSLVLYTAGTTGKPRGVPPVDPAEVADPARLLRYDLSSIEQIVLGAAPVAQSLKQWVVERFGEDVLWESYGASEPGMISFTPPEFQLSKPGTSGRPYDGVEIAIVDEDWNRLPAGQIGEIAVSTPIVLRNYLGGPPLGRDVIKDGFYRTGDVGYLDSDGFVFLTDRIKDMIVAGGVNIYPAEIENVEDLPRNPVGKVQKNILRQPFWQGRHRNV